MPLPELMAGLRIALAEDRMALHERKSNPAHHPPPPPPPPRKSANYLISKSFSTLPPPIYLPGRSFPAPVLFRSEPGFRPTSGSAQGSWRRTRVGPRVSIVEDAVRKEAPAERFRRRDENPNGRLRRALTGPRHEVPTSARLAQGAPLLQARRQRRRRNRAKRSSNAEVAPVEALLRMFHAPFHVQAARNRGAFEGGRTRPPLEGGAKGGN